MMQSGIFTGYFPYGLEETAKRIRGHGFNTAQLDLHFKDIDLGPGNLTAASCKRVRDTFRAHDLPICCVSGWMDGAGYANSAIARTAAADGAMPLTASVLLALCFVP